MTVIFVVTFLLAEQLPAFFRLIAAGNTTSVANENYRSSITAKVSDPSISTHRIEEENPVLQVLNEYKEQHSYHVLAQEWEETQRGKLENKSNLDMDRRRFALGVYGCPFQAGNRLHHFFNSLIWSIVTNRTFLYHYFDRKTCIRLTRRNGRGDPGICYSANTEQECDEVLKRKDWIPPSGKWRYRLQIKNMRSFSFWSTAYKQPDHKLWKNNSEQYAGIIDIRDNRLVEFALMLGQDAAFLKNEVKRKYVLSTEEAQNRAKQLMALGEDYLYGLLFHECFQFRSSIIQDTTFYSNSKNTTVTSNQHAGSTPPILIAVHSRHSIEHDEGSKIKRESKCLDGMLKSMLPPTNYSISCDILLLSDRQNTLTTLQDYIASTYPQCHAVVAKHDNDTSWRPEHGPFAGIGFYQDLAMVNTAMKSLSWLHLQLPQVGFIGSKHRSSSQLVREILAYHYEGYRLQSLDASSKTGIVTCLL